MLVLVNTAERTNIISKQFVSVMTVRLLRPTERSLFFFLVNLYLSNMQTNITYQLHLINQAMSNKCSSMRMHDEQANKMERSLNPRCLPFLSFLLSFFVLSVNGGKTMFQQK